MRRLIFLHLLRFPVVLSPPPPPPIPRLCPPPSSQEPESSELVYYRLHTAMQEIIVAPGALCIRVVVAWGCLGLPGALAFIDAGVSPCPVTSCCVLACWRAGAVVVVGWWA